MKCDHEIVPNKNIYGFDICKKCEKDQHLILMQELLEESKKGRELLLSLSKEKKK